MRAQTWDVPVGFGGLPRGRMEDNITWKSVFVLMVWLGLHLSSKVSVFRRCSWLTPQQCFPIWQKIARFRSSILISWRLAKLSYILLISIARKLVPSDSLEPEYSLCQRLVLPHLIRFLVQYHRLKVFNASFEQLFIYNLSLKFLVSPENQLAKNLCCHHFILAKKPENTLLHKHKPRTKVRGEPAVSVLWTGAFWK
jgi:hypothetical protein